MPRRSAIRITKSRVDAMKPGEQVWDADIAGFGIVANKNSKTYKLKYMFQGRQRMMSLGKHGAPLTVDQARKKAIACLGELHSGKDPATASATRGMRMSELCEKFLVEHARPLKKRSSVHMDELNIRNHVLPLIGDRRVIDVSTADIERFKLAIRDGKTAPDDKNAHRKNPKGGSVVQGGEYVANRCLALLSKMFSLAERWELRDKNTNPVQGVERFKEHRHERFLTSEELVRLADILSEAERTKTENLFVIAAIRLLILTGARLSEILTLKWSMVDFERRMLRLPDSKTGAKPILLSEPAVEVLKGLPRLQGNEFVIVGGVDGQHLKNLRKPWGHIRERAGLSDLRLHDLRHSFASFAIAEGVSLPVIGKLLGHKKTATTERYAHLANDYVSEASRIIGEKIGSMTSSTKHRHDEPDSSERSDK